MSVTSVMSVKVSFEMGEKSSRIYIIKIIIIFIIYIRELKKGELKIEFDTHDTRDTHDTLWRMKKVNCHFFTCLFDT